MKYPWGRPSVRVCASLFPPLINIPHFSTLSSFDLFSPLTLHSFLLFSSSSGALLGLFLALPSCPKRPHSSPLWGKGATLCFIPGVCLSMCFLCSCLLIFNVFYYYICISKENLLLSFMSFGVVLKQLWIWEYHMITVMHSFSVKIISCSVYLRFTWS